jgi:hypothetical protein
VSGGTAQLFLNLGTKSGCVVSITPRPALPQERPVTHCIGGWVGPGVSLDRCGKTRPTGIRSPDLPARSESLYRLSYPGSIYNEVKGILKNKDRWIGVKKLTNREKTNNRRQRDKAKKINQWKEERSELRTK